MSERKIDFLATLAGIVANVFWGFSYLFIRLALMVTEPVVMLSLRFMTSTLLMGALLVVTGRRVRIRGKALIPMLILMIAEPLGYFCESYSILYTNATLTGISMAVVPIFAIAMAALILKEYPSKRLILLSMIPIIGVILITVSGSEIGVVTPIGMFFLCSTCMCYAVYRITNKIAARQFDSTERSFLVLISCTVVFTTVALKNLHGDVGALFAPLKNPGFLLPMLTLSVFCSIISNLCANYAAQNLTILKFSVIGTLTTIVSTISGVVFLHEPMTTMILLGAVMIIYGITRVSLVSQAEQARADQAQAAE